MSVWCQFIGHPWVSEVRWDGRVLYYRRCVRCGLYDFPPRADALADQGET